LNFDVNDGYKGDKLTAGYYLSSFLLILFLLNSDFLVPSSLSEPTFANHNLKGSALGDGID